MGPAKPANLTHWAHESSKRARRPTVAGAPKFRPWQAQSRRQTWQSGEPRKISVTSRPSKDHLPYKMEPQHFIRGRSQRPWASQSGVPKLSIVAGPARKSVQQPRQTLQTMVPKFHPWQASQDHKRDNLESQYITVAWQAQQRPRRLPNLAGPGRPQALQSVAGPAKTISLTIWSSKITPVAGTARPSNHHKPWQTGGSKLSSVAGPVKTANVTIWGPKILSQVQAQQRPWPYKMEPWKFLRGRSKDHKPNNLELQNFACGRPSQAQTTTTLQTGVPANLTSVAAQSRAHKRDNLGHEILSLGFQNFVRGRPSQEKTNLAIWGTKILSQAGPAKTMSLTKWSLKISSVAGAKTISLTIWSSKILLVAGPARPSNHHKPCKQWGSQISSVAGPVKTTNVTIWSTMILLLAGPAKTTSLTEMEPQNFIRGKPSKDHKPDNLEFQDFTLWQAQPGPAITTNLENSASKISSATWASQDLKPGNLGYENFVAGKPSKDHEPYKWNLKISSVAGPAKTISLAIWSSKISLVTGPARPSNHHKPWKQRFQNFIRDNFTCDRPQPATTTNLENRGSKISSATGPVKTTKRWQSGTRKYCRWQAQQPPQTMQTRVPKFRPWQAQSRPQTWQWLASQTLMIARNQKTFQIHYCETTRLPDDNQVEPGLFPLAKMERIEGFQSNAGQPKWLKPKFFPNQGWKIQRKNLIQDEISKPVLSKHIREVWIAIRNDFLSDQKAITNLQAIDKVKRSGTNSCLQQLSPKEWELNQGKITQPKEKQVDQEQSLINWQLKTNQLSLVQWQIRNRLLSNQNPG